jgi:hypothetical protein
MQATKVACPLCQGVFTLADAAPLGKSVRCQKCGAPFSVTADDLRRAQAAPATPTPRTAASAAADAPWWAQPETPGAAPQPVPPIPVAAIVTPPVPVAKPVRPAAPVVPVAAPYRPPAAPVAATVPSPACAAGPPAPVARAPGSSAPRSPSPGIPPLLILGGVVAGLVMLLAVSSVVAFICLGNTPDQTNVSQVPPKTDRGAPKGFVPIPKKEDKDGVAKDPPVVDDVPPKKEGPKDDPPRKDEDVVRPPPPKDKEPDKPKQVDKDPKPVVRKDFVVTPELQKKIDEAIAKGVKFLKEEQSADGSWRGGHTLGTTALPALTLLECGVPGTDPKILKAADWIRHNWQNNTATYEISLAILFLDRHGKKGDKTVIQALALRLIAGQNTNGGWDYDCPKLTDKEATDLLTMLKKTRPKAPPILIDKGDKGDKTLPNPLDKKNDLKQTIPDKDKTGNPGLNSPALAAPQIAAPGVPPKQPPKKDGKPPKGGPKSNRDDNSNTQFAMLALWAARRHDIPVENVMALIEKRFRTSQMDNGAWGYHYNDGSRGKPSMTCVGLLGLALGNGSAGELALRNYKGDPKAAPAAKKPAGVEAAIALGIEALAPHLEKHIIEGQNFPPGISLYFVWSVERVGVLYGFRKIGEHDWYEWGVNLLLPTQRINNGCWDTHSYPGANPTIDTCFALLFLKRVNLVQDLTDNLRLYIGITEPGVVPPK